MKEEFNNKDYAEYFSKLENSLTKKADVQHSSNIKIKSKKSSIKRRRFAFVIGCFSVAIAITVMISGIITALSGDKKPHKQADTNESAIKADDKNKIIYPFKNSDTLIIGSEADSQHIIIVETEGNSIIAMKDAFSRAYPASTTKIMTLLTAVDYINDYSDTFTMTYEITDPLFVAGATVAGFSAGEAITLEDMLYGIILPSGGDASIGIAVKIAGSEQAFVKLMNKKAKSMGLKDTNFTNCTGLFDKNHYTTAADMAVILSEAMKNPLCRKIMSTYKYTTKPTKQHPNGLELTSTLFSYMYGTEPEGADILGGKTGFVNESGYCIASYGKNDLENEYIVVTLEASSKWPAFYGQIDLYTSYVGKKTETQ